MYLLVMKQLITMFIIGLCGFIFAKAFKVDEDQRKFLSKLLLYFINPSVIINSFNKEFDGGKLKQLLFVAALALVVHGIMILVGLLSSKDQIDRLGIAFTNCGFIGIPLIRGVFGDEGVFYLMGYLVIFNLLIWTYGYHQLSGTANFKKIITNPNIIAVALGIVLYCMPFTLPQVLATPLSMISDLNTAVSMIVIGVLIASFNSAEGKEYIWKITKFSILRLLICSFICTFVLLGIYKICGNFPDVRMLIFVVMICLSCPVATTIPGLACVFDKNASYASLIVSVTSLLCIVTLPLMVAFAELIIK